MRDIMRRKDIIIQPADKGGAITVMKKEWYKERMSEQITKDYKIIGKNDRKTREEITEKIIRNCEEEYGKKNLRKKGMKYVEGEGLIPKRRGCHVIWFSRFMVNYQSFKVNFPAICPECR